jgi:hypothetical protein
MIKYRVPYQKVVKNGGKEVFSAISVFHIIE